jgi:hypothetical protein
MKQKNAITLSAAAVALVAVFGLSAFSYASEGGGWGKRLGQNPENFGQENRPDKEIYKGMKNESGKAVSNFGEIHAAIEAGDYEAWSNLKSGKRMAEFITEENFDKLVEMHNLMQAGDIEGAIELREELGIPGKGRGMGIGGGKMFGNCPRNR